MERTRLVPMSIQIVEKYDTRSLEPEFQGPSGAVVVSANKNIGFGQSATQEEVFVGNCPETCPAVLVTPTLQPDQTLTIEGAIPMLRIVGQRRSVSWQALTQDYGAGGRLLFMDALEIDELDDMNGLPDLQPENIQREIRKAYTAFSSWESEGEANVFAGLWGCGAFNGDPGVKVAVMWIAGSIAGRKLNVICDDVHDPFLVDLKQLLDQVPDSWTVQDLNQLLQRIPRHTKRLETVNAMLRLLS
jgi:poly(ADP-ribose) glycohydrolase